MMLCNFCIGVADVYVAGRIGREAQAAMGLIAQAMFFFQMVAIAVANGSVAAITQSLGAGKRLRAMRYAGLCLAGGAGLGLGILVFGLLTRGLFLDLLNAPDPVRAPAEDILFVFLLLLPANSVLIISSAVLRAHQMVKLPLASMALVCLINAWLDFGLGLGRFGLPEMGYRGVAWATFWSVTGGTMLNLWLMRRAKLLRRRMLPPWRWVPAAGPYLFKVAWPSGLMQVVWHTGYLVLLAITGGLPRGGVEALAGFAAGARIESGVFLPAFAFNLSASILVGHCLGAGDPREAKRMGYRVWALGLVLMGLVAVAVWHFLPELSMLFSDDPAVIEQTRLYLRYNILAAPFTLTGLILAGALTGAGATVYNLVVFGVSIWGVRLPMAWWLGWRIWGTAEGVWLSMLCSQVFQASTLFLVYTFKNWSAFSMIKPKERP